MLLPIRFYPDKILREVCEPIVAFDDELRELVNNMIETMYASEGIGLAAPQVGVLQRVIIVDISEAGGSPQEFINPEILEIEPKQVDSEEGCLSIPGFRAVIQRSPRLTVRAQNLNGDFFEIEADDLYARCLQHEIDHINGKLFVDYLSSARRPLFRSWLKKQSIDAE
jgi:peptide deformylase